MHVSMITAREWSILVKDYSGADLKKGQCEVI